MDMQKKTIILCSTLVAAIAIGLGVFFWWNGASLPEPSVVPPGGSSQADGSYYPRIPDVSKQLAAAESQNKDVVGWLMVPNTTVNEPVVQSTDNEYYLRRDYLGKYDYEGCYYVDYESAVLDSGADLAKNTIVYGHNLGKPRGTTDNPEAGKFAQLLLLQQEEIARQTPYIYFVTPAETYVFEIFAVFYTESNMSPVPYHYAEYDPQDFSTLVQDAKARSTYSYDVPVHPNDKILTLSTCSYKYGPYSQNKNQRYVVMARLHPKEEPFTSAAPITPNPAPKQPTF